jgi:hypothetical protein
VRWPAVAAWQKALEARGFPLIDATTRLLARDVYPNLAQERLLLGWGLGRTLWNALTVTGVVEGHGRRLVGAPVPFFQAIIEEDIAATATGHLGKGLLTAHGLDEAGDPDADEGGHDAMWFAVRDLLFGRDAYPLPEVPESLARPEERRRMPLVPAAHEQMILLLMNVLMIEIRAERFFAFCTALMRAPDLFRDRRAAAEHAAVLVDRIRQDEAIHVAYLQTVVSELRSFTFRTEGGARVPGARFIDPVWEGMVAWHSATALDEARERTRQGIAAYLATAPDGARRLAQFDALASAA